MSAANDYNTGVEPLAPLYDRLDDRSGFEVEQPHYYGQSLEPYAELQPMQKSNPDEVFPLISEEDYANLNSLNGVTMTYYPQGKSYTRASVRAEKILLQDNFDGAGKSPGTFDEVIWYDNGEGRYVMDLPRGQPQGRRLGQSLEPYHPENARQTQKVPLHHMGRRQKLARHQLLFRGGCV